MKTLEDLFLHLLKDVYYAEKHILKELPKMAKKAESDKLKKAFEHHAMETEGQVQRLEQVFEKFGKPARGEKCEALDGMVEEAKEIMKDAKDPDVLDAGLIAAAQAVEHYEISRYGTLIAWAKQLKKNEVAQLLDQTLKQEYAADDKLSQLAESSVNKQAA